MSKSKRILRNRQSVAPEKAEAPARKAPARKAPARKAPAKKAPAKTNAKKTVESE